MAGAFLGLYGGREVSFALRTTIDSVLLTLYNYGRSLTTLTEVAANYNFDTGELPALRDQISSFAEIVSLVQQFATPVDGARLAILYSAMTLGMLAAIGLALGACLRRKEVLGVSFVSATLAILVAWFSFAVNYPMAVTMDDSCVTLTQVLSNTVVSVNGVEFLIGCLPPSLFVDLNDATRAAAYEFADRLAQDEADANAVNPNNFNPITVSRSALNATFPNMTTFSNELNEQYNETIRVEAAFPCAGTCTDNITDWQDNILGFGNMSLAARALVELQDCANIERVLAVINESLCQQLVTGVLLTFIGSIVIGSLLIPMAVMGLYVAQKFPNRSPAARTRARILVIYVFLVFHCLVALLAEVNTTWIELATMISSMIGGCIGFIIINLPMMRWNWKISTQVLLSLFLALYFGVTLAGWIYLFYYAVINNISCGQEASNLAASILMLPSFGVPGTLQSLLPQCTQTEYSHSIIVAIFCGTGSFMVATSVLMSVILAGKIGCGTPLVLNDSDYELD